MPLSKLPASAHKADICALVSLMGLSSGIVLNFCSTFLIQFIQISEIFLTVFSEYPFINCEVSLLSASIIADSISLAKNPI